MSTVKMVAIKCPSCNGTVTQEDAKDGYCTCPSCGTTFMIHDDTPKTVNYLREHYNTIY